MRFLARVYVATPDGVVERVSPDEGLHYQASMHPAGQAVVFYGGRSGFPRLWRRDLQTGGLDPITEESSGARHATYSWDGERIAFVSDRASPVPGESIEELYPGTRRVRPDAQLHLYVAQGDGSAVRQITDGPFRDLRPTFTPDGRALVFASDRRPGPTLWRVSIDGPTDPVLLWDRSWGYRPWCTRSGGAVVFYGADGSRHRLFRLDLPEAIVTPLASDDRGDTHGPFVPEHGTSVLAHSNRGGDWGLWEFGLSDGDEPPRCVTPPGFERASHPTSSSDGTMAFDVVEQP